MDRRGWQKLGRLSGVSTAVFVFGTVLWAGGCSDDDDLCDGFGCADPPSGGDAGKGPDSSFPGFDSGVTPPPLCKYPSDCPDGKSCVNGQCIPSCTVTDAGDDSCADGYKCVKGVCQQVPTPPQCREDKDCAESGATPKCRGGRCVQACDPANDKCPPGQYCDPGGACIPDTRPKPNCSATDMSACKSNQTCVEGYCKYRCQDDQTCSRIDSRLAWCGVDKVCRTEKEAHPQCTTSCPAPQQCIDNVCK